MSGHIILLCRNNVALSRACLKTLQAQEPPCEILVIDNASTDGTKEWLRTEQGWRMSFQTQKSVAECWNRGLRWMWQRRAEEVLVLNNDTECLPRTYGVLRDWRSDEGMVTCISVRERERLVEPATFTSAPHPDFSCFMIWRSAWEAVGGFDEGYEGAFVEDCDFHVRLHRAGIKAVSITLPFLHHGSATVRRADPEERRRIGEAADRNRRRFFEKYGAWPGTKGYEALFTAAAEVGKVAESVPSQTSDSA